MTLHIRSDFGRKLRGKFYGMISAPDRRIPSDRAHPKNPIGPQWEREILLDCSRTLGFQSETPAETGADRNTSGDTRRHKVLSNERA